MYNKEIDVAAIMRDIKSRVIPENSTFIEIDDCESKENREIISIINEVDRIHSFINNTRENSADYLDFGMRIPEYSRFPYIIRKILVLITRIMRKLTRFLAKDQTIVNKNTDATIKALVESQEQLLKSIKNTMELNNRNNHLEKEINSLRNLLKTNENGISDEFYLEFENTFRGSEDDIKKRLSFYIENYLKTDLSIGSTDKCVDLGCGRGEWLDLLKENGYCAIGLDTNQDMVNRAREKEHDVVAEDAISYLKSMPEESAKVVTAFQLIEHLKTNQIVDLISEIKRVLVPGGIMIIETPNIGNVEVGCNNFYVDPTHIKPVHQKFLEFLAKNVGFSRTEIVFWNKTEIDQWWEYVNTLDVTDSNKSEVIRTIAETIRKNFYVCPDYALISRK